MRFMVIVKATPESEKEGALPDPELSLEMGKYNEAKGEDVKTVEELPRNANSPVTMNVYAQGVTELKRKAHPRIVRMVTGGKDEEAEETA